MRYISYNELALRATPGEAEMITEIENASVEKIGQNLPGLIEEISPDMITHLAPAVTFTDEGVEINSEEVLKERRQDLDMRYKQGDKSFHLIAGVLLLDLIMRVP